LKRFAKTAISVVVIFLLYQGFNAYENGELPGVFSQSGQPAQNLPGHSIKGMQQAADPEDCQLVHKSIAVYIDPSRYPLTADHVIDAKRAGEAKVLHLDREGADDNRDDSLAGIPTKDGHDRDEYPPAASAEGGQGASVRYVPSSDNRGAGSSMGAQLGDYCSGQAFVLLAK